MPLLYIERIDEYTQLGTWQFDACTHIENVCPPDALLNEMLGRGGWIIDHEDSGRPILRQSDMEIGISHTKNYASIILSKRNRVAVDIEYISDRICKIEDKFMRADERDYSQTLYGKINVSSDTRINKACILLLFWCAKETMYKYYSDEHLALQDIKIEQITSNGIDNGNIICQNTLSGETKTLEYKVNDSTVLTYLV